MTRINAILALQRTLENRGLVTRTERLRHLHDFCVGARHCIVGKVLQLIVKETILYLYHWLLCSSYQQKLSILMRRQNSWKISELISLVLTDRVTRDIHAPVENINNKYLHNSNYFDIRVFTRALTCHELPHHTCERWKTQHFQLNLHYGGISTFFLSEYSNMTKLTWAFATPTYTLSLLLHLCHLIW